MFPGLINQLKHQSNRCYVGDHYLRHFYDLGVRPAAQVQLPNHYERTWPVDFDAQHYRAQSTSSAHLHQTSWDFEGKELNPLLVRIHELVDAHKDLSWALHPPEDLVDFDPDQSLFDFEATLRQDALVRLLKDFVSEEIDQNSWYVDVATTISIAEHNGHPLCTLPLAKAHTEIINHLTQKPMDQCEQWTSSRASAYQFDEITHLGNVASFWLDVLNSPSLQGVTYLQCYISDKLVTYHLDSSSGVHAKRTLPYHPTSNKHRAV
ncbi:hypothetical protein FRC06_002361 [Ceratobasidium sp. 370]|nr:hypothetical protein FRC06_002361 [Ceratobasidium sp. 370]